LSDDSSALSVYTIYDDCTIHVIDTNPNSVLKNFDDLSAVEKYMISESDYDKLPSNFRKFK
jgi:hypothetical protein